MTEPTLSQLPEDADQPATKGTLYQLQSWINKRFDELLHTTQSDHVDREKLKAAIIRRRDRTRREHQDWEHSDRDAWPDAA